MKTTIRERLMAFIEYKGLRVSHFEKSVGLCNSYVRNIRKSISPDKLEQITNVYPELNVHWLLTGTGEMLVNASDEPIPIIEESAPEETKKPTSPCEDISETVRALTAALKAKDDALKAKDDEVQFLRQMLKDLQDSVRNFLAKNNVKVD